MVDEATRTTAGGVSGCLGCFAIFLIIFISTSITSVETTQWAVKYNWWSESVDETVIIKPGLTWVGMGNYLIKLPNVNQNVYFRDVYGSGFGSDEDIIEDPIHVRTYDGLSIKLELEFTYKLQSENLRQLYLLVGNHDDEGGSDTVPYRTILTTMATSVIDNWACTFSAQEFYQNRTLIQTTFQEQLTTTLSKLLYIDLMTLQLQPAHFPDAYSHSIKLTQYYDTDIEVAVQEQLTAMIKKESQKKVSEVLAQKIEVEAEAEAQQIMYENQAEVAQFIYKQQKQAEGYGQALGFFQTMDGNNPSTVFGLFNDYMRVRALKAHSDETMAVRVR